MPPLTSALIIILTASETHCGSFKMCYHSVPRFSLGAEVNGPLFSLTHRVQFLQSLCFPRGAAEAAGAGRRTGNVGPAAAAAAAVLQLDERPVGWRKGKKGRGEENEMLQWRIETG